MTWKEGLPGVVAAAGFLLAYIMWRMIKRGGRR